MTKKIKWLFFGSLLLLITECKTSNEHKYPIKISLSDSIPLTIIAVEKEQEVKKEVINESVDVEEVKDENIIWIQEHVNKEFLLGNVVRKDNPLFVKIDTVYTERSIYLLAQVYEAFKNMYDAAIADSVKLIITSGHRLFGEQVYEWELRWNNPRTEIVFENDTDKAIYILKYRAMPGTTRHHWGTDIDLNSFELAYYETQEGRKVYDWLKTNAKRFGFYQPYTPKDSNRATGYEEEKWHWSYKPLSQYMLAKYLELVSIDDIAGFEGDTAAKKLPILSGWVSGINQHLKETD